MSKKEKKLKVYCSKCGEQMFDIQTETEMIRVFHYDSGGGVYWGLDAPYSSKTGERNIADVYVCPAYEKRWYGSNGHDQFVYYKGERHYAFKYD